MNNHFYLHLLENLPIPVYGLTQFMISKITYNSVYKMMYIPNSVNNFTNKYGLFNGKQTTAIAATFYMFINNLRAVIYWNGLHTQQFLGIELTTYDHYFIMPIIFGIINYSLLKTSTHKSLYQIQQDQNQYKLINLCFMSSLAVVGLPLDILMIYSIMGCCQTIMQYNNKQKIIKILRDSQIKI